MGVNIYNDSIEKCYLGVDEITAIYQGTELLYSSVPPTPFEGKWLATYSDSSIVSAECNSTTEINQNEIPKTDIISLIIGDCVTIISQGACMSYSGLTSVKISSSVTALYASAFAYCTSLTSVTIPNSVTSIGPMSFQGCSGLKRCKIGSGVTEIGLDGFRDCNSLESITCLSVTPPTLGNLGVFPFNGCPIYVPAQSVEAYKTTGNWWNYASRIQAIQ